MSIELLGITISPFVRKVAALCAEKQIPITNTPVVPLQPPQGWRDTSPLGKIPALVHDGKIVNDSSVICAYLERCFPDTPLYPKDAYARARAEWLEEYADSGVISVLGPKVFWPCALDPMLNGTDPDEATIAEAKRVVDEEMPAFYSYLEAQLGDGEYFVDGTLSIADLAIASVLVNGRHAGFPPDAARFPKLAAFVQRMHARESFASLIEAERKQIGKRWA